MKSDSSLELLRCPLDHKALMQKEEVLVCSECRREYPLRQGIPDLVPEENDGTAALNLEEEHWEKLAPKRRNAEHPAVRAVYDPIASWVTRELGGDGKLILDVGCGNGFLSEALCRAGHTVMGVDVSIPHLASFSSGRCYRALASSLPFAADSFDAVLEGNMLHHIPPSDRIAAVSEMRRVADSALFFIEPNARNPFMRMFLTFGKQEQGGLDFSHSYLQKLLSDSGCENNSVQTQGWVLPNKAPCWWLPVGGLLEKTFMHRFGFYLWGHALL